MILEPAQDTVLMTPSSSISSLCLYETLQFMCTTSVVEAEVQQHGSMRMLQLSLIVVIACRGEL